MSKTTQAAADLDSPSPEQRGSPVSARQKAATELAVRPAASLAAPQAVSETMHMMHMLERLAKNKEVDVGKMKEIKDLAMAMRAEQSEQEFNVAMAQAQAEMEPVRVDAANKSTNSKYASYAALDRAIRPIYTKHGFTLSFDTEDGAPEGFVRVVCYVTCRGHTRKHHIDIGNDGKGAKGGDVMTKTHAAGSAMTYGQRYLKKMIFDIAVDRDDDGNASSRKQQLRHESDAGFPGDTAYITSDQITALRDKCKQVGCAVEKFLHWADVATFEEIRASEFESCMAGLASFRKAR